MLPRDLVGEAEMSDEVLMPSLPPRVTPPPPPPSSSSSWRRATSLPIPASVLERLDAMLIPPRLNPLKLSGSPLDLLMSIELEEEGEWRELKVEPPLMRLACNELTSCTTLWSSALSSSSAAPPPPPPPPLPGVVRWSVPWDLKELKEPWGLAVTPRPGTLLSLIPCIAVLRLERLD